MKTLVMLMGPPASGKTTTHDHSFAGMPLICSDQYWPTDKKGRRYWMDDDGMRRSWEDEPFPPEKLAEAWADADMRFTKALAEGTDIVFEAVFALKEQREKFIKRAKYFGYSVIGMCFFPSLMVCVHRNKRRRHAVPDQVLARYYGQFELPTKDEGYDRLDIRR